MGSDNNEGFFTHVQLNIAAPAKFNSGATLSSDLGGAGVAHGDDGDDPHSLSALMALGDLGSMHPGNMHLVEFGLYKRLDYLTLFMFSGRHIHGATPPQPLTPDFIMQKFFTRLLTICYPKLLAMDRFNLGAYTISAWPFVDFQEYFEHDLRIYESALMPNSHLNFAHDGGAAMQRPSLVSFIVRELLHLVLRIVAQVSPSLPIRMDPLSFLRSFSFQGEDGSWVQVGDWLLAPGISPAVDTERERIKDLLIVRTRASSLTIPKIVAGFKEYLDAPPPITLVDGDDDGSQAEVNDDSSSVEIEIDPDVLAYQERQAMVLSRADDDSSSTHLDVDVEMTGDVPQFVSGQQSYEQEEDGEVEVMDVDQDGEDSQSGDDGNTDEGSPELPSILKGWNSAYICLFCYLNTQC